MIESDHGIHRAQSVSRNHLLLGRCFRTYGSAEALKKIPRETFSDWNPATVIEVRQLGIPSALVEIEAVAIAREAKSR